MKPISDLNAILKDDYSFQYDWEGQGLQNVTISTHKIGELVVTSGKIIACDPLVGPDTRYHFEKSLKPGNYPVIASIADFTPAGDARIACALLQISDATTVRWETALMNQPAPDRTGDITYYGVDAGTGCFADCDAAQILENLFPLEDEFEEVCDRILAEMEKNSFGKYSTAGWADVQVSDTTDANIIAFSSGWGDGGYRSFWGYDDVGNLTSLVTDFALFPNISAPA